MCASEPGALWYLPGLQRAAQAWATEFVELVVHQLVQNDIALVWRTGIDNGKRYAI